MRTEEAHIRAGTGDGEHLRPYDRARSTPVQLVDRSNCMGITDLLKALAKGAYDGERTDSETNGVSSGFYIDRGTPVKYREGRGTKFFDGKENIRTPGKRSEERFETDEEKTLFFKKYGFISDMFGDHPEVMEYSRDYYESKKTEERP